MTENDVLTRNQRRVLAALLASKSIGEAAGKCGLSERTISRYLEKPAFRAALAQAEGEMIDDAGRHLLAGQEKALATLEDLIAGAAKDADRRLAAIAWLDLLIRWREQRVLEKRITELEEKIYGRSE